MRANPNGATTACSYEYVGNKLVKFEDCENKSCPQSGK